MTSLRADLEAALRGRYRLVGEAEAGGMARVFRAVDERYDREVAIKVVRPELAATLGPERFEREIAVAARLNHPHLVPVFDSGRVGDHEFYVMPFVQGESLRQRLEREGRLEPAAAMRVARDIATGLAHAHAAGILHRDIKPANILLAGGSALLTDFGIALPMLDSVGRLTETGISMGTLLYMSPEQLAGERSLDHRSDLYSLGAVLFEMVTGSPPHDPRTPAELIGRRLAGPPGELATGGGVPDEVRPILRRLLAVDPADRFGSADELVRALDAPRAAAEPGRTPVRRGTGAIVAVAVVLGALALAQLLRRPATTAATSVSQVAVLPFSNLGADPASEYYSDGLGEELINALSQVAGLRVAPRTSSWAYKGRNLDVRVLGDSLGVGAIVEGGVRRSSDGLRVTARLIRTSDGQALWAGEFDDRSRSDIFAIQDSIVAAIAGAIRAHLMGAADPAGPFNPAAGGQAAGTGRPASYFGTRSVEAHDLYLRARFEWNRRNSESVLRSIDHFREAITRDSGYVAAWAGLAEALAVAAFYDWLSPAEAFPEARRTARRALALEPGAGEPYATLGYVALWHDWDLPAAEAEFRRAITLRPRYAQAHQWYANLLTAAGRFDEARAEWRAAAALEPLALIMLAARGWTEYFAGNPAATVEIERRAIARDPTFALGHYWLGLGLESEGRYPEAVAAFRRSAALTGDDALALTGIAHAFAASGQHDSAIAIVTTLSARASDRPLPLFEMATVYVAIGDTARALAWLDRAAAARSHSIPLAPADPRLAALRGQPRFERLLAAVHRQ